MEPAYSPIVTVPTANRTIVVEDEDLLREFVTAALAGLGCRVLAAENGRVALEIWAAHRDEIDLLLTDLVMLESISGRQLAHELVTQRPDLKVIFTSGYSPSSSAPTSSSTPSTPSSPNHISPTAWQRPSPYASTANEQRRVEPAPVKVPATRAAPPAGAAACGVVATHFA